MDLLSALLALDERLPLPVATRAARLTSAIESAGLEALAIESLAHRDDPVAVWVRGAAAEKLQRWDDAADSYARVVDERGREIPDILIRRARLDLRAGRLATAAALLHDAFRMHVDTALLLRAESLVRKLKQQIAIRRKARIALAGSVTTQLLRTALQAFLWRDGIDVEFYEAPFGAFEQEIFAPASRLYAFNPDVVVLLFTWRDAGLSGWRHVSAGELDSAVQRFTRLWDELKHRTNPHIVQTTLNTPAEDPLYAVAPAAGAIESVREINRRLHAARTEGVSLVDTEFLAGIGSAPWEDPLKWSSAKLYPSAENLPLLAEHIVSHVRAASGLSSKLLALDLDNTLWGGIIGEDGLAGIRLGPPSAEGERYAELHSYFRALKDRGVLLAVASKNNPDDARSVFQHHDASGLRLDDFIAFEANWEPKAQSLKHIAKSLNLGLDSFVFLDDNPVERAAIRRELPDVIVPEITGEPAETIGALERGLYFQTLSITAEDRSRTASYAALAKTRTSAGMGGDYLEDLQMQVSWGRVDEITSERVTQLINKTNQFNLTTRRYTREQVVALMGSPRHWFAWFRLRDRYADHGLIAILMAELVSDDTWSVDSWLMSCRVIGRGVEQFMFNRLLEAARNAGATSIRARYVPTAKNEPVRDLLSKLGFAESAEAGAYTLDVSGAAEMPCDGLKLAMQQTSGSDL